MTELTVKPAVPDLRLHTPTVVKTMTVDRRKVRQADADKQRQMRDMIDGKALLSSVQAIMHALLYGMEVRTIAGEDVEVPIIAERAAQLRTVLDIHMQLLRKILPDLKSVEVTGDAAAVAAAYNIITAIARNPGDPLPATIEGEVVVNPVQPDEVSFL